MRIAFYGTPEFAVETLKRIHNTNHEVAAVITAPDKPAGRGKKITSSPVKDYALAHNLPLLQPKNLKAPEFLRELKTRAIELQVVVAFRMIPEVVWAFPTKGTFNIHASLLPQYRGAAPINHAIINGEKKTGVTSFFITKEIDTGAIISYKETPIGESETAGELHDRLMSLAADLAVETIEKIQTGNYTLKTQNELMDPTQKLKTAPKIYKNDCRIDWRKSVSDIYNFVRGLNPYPAAFTQFIDGEGITRTIKVYEVEMILKNHEYEFYKIITDNKTYLWIPVKDGIISILELQQNGKKRMRIEEFLRGVNIGWDWKLKHQISQ
ncbi:MAG: methionyl-tRNA formyltransferase [Bacteroidales bacterium]|nr:methionyl-tRNA formyltransferase [Bacteroidales bacterium]MCF8333635.1 methionyl-tRNA formyltransferase [Bacteroidales bacterium]